MNTEELLHKYLDGTCTNAEKDAFEKSLSSDPLLKKEYEMLRALERSLKDREPDLPAYSFTDKVMAKLPEAKEEQEPLVSRKLAGFGVSLVLLMLLLPLGLSVGYGGVPTDIPATNSGWSYIRKFSDFFALESVEFLVMPTLLCIGLMVLLSLEMILGRRRQGRSSLI